MKQSYTFTGLVPSDPERVFLKINIRLRTPSPPPGQDIVSEPITPENQERILKHEIRTKPIHRKISKSPRTFDR